MEASDRRPKVVLLSEGFAPDPSKHYDIHVFTNPAIPAADQLRGYDLILCVGPFTSADRAAQIGGALALAMDRGATLVFAYLVRFQSSDDAVLRPVLRLSWEQLTGGLKAIADMPEPHPAFREYLTEYGRGDLGFSSLPDNAETLGEKVATESPYTTRPCAFWAPVRQGSLYVLPFHLVAESRPFVERLLASVLSHRQGADESEPEFFSEIDLPGEASLVGDIRQLRGELAEREQQVAQLRRHKQLVGRFAGAALESLVIDELNLVLAGSGAQARDTPELRGEDFEIAVLEGRIAIAESKAESGGVSFSNINQINNARSALDLGADEMPGVLVINQFRNDNYQDRRRGRLEDRLVRHAQRQNVLVLRTWDLYHLVARRLAGNDDSAEVRAAIEGGGGWLEANARTSSITRRRRARSQVGIQRSRAASRTP